MKRLMVVVILLAGCAQEALPPRPAHPHTTVYQYTSASATCPEPLSPKANLRAMTKSRDEWKKYAESLETLMPADATHVTHP